MIQDFITALIFFLPAGIANMTPLLINKVPLLNQWSTPLDFGRTWHGERIFGDNKRWRGLLSGMLMGGVTAFATQMYLGSYLPYTGSRQAFIAGLALGAGALIGDALESFFKRQIGIKPGDSWFPFDQLDYIIGGLMAVYILVPVSFKLASFIVFIYFGLHLYASYIGYLLKLKDKPI